MEGSKDGKMEGSDVERTKGGKEEMSRRKCGMGERHKVNGRKERS